MADPARAFGIWLVDKPAGPTSHDVVAMVRRNMPKGTRVGHAGTLDPFATGLLVILVGQATRLAQFLVGLDKTYRARVRLGETSATGDPEGPIVATGAPLPDANSVALAVATFRGPQRQRVPALAAVKVDGERLYARTRRGEATALPEREIVIDAADVVDRDPDGRWVDVDIRCSKGTYIRQFAADLGERLGCGGYCERLRRTATGAMTLDGAVAPDAVRATGGIDARLALAPMPVRDLDPSERVAVGHGRPVSGDASGPTLLVCEERPIAVAVPSDGVLQPKVVLV